jgi:hypothetical protein
MMATNEVTRCKPRLKKRKRLKPKPKPVKKASDHPPECAYPRFRRRVRTGSKTYRTMTKTAKLLGEVEAGMTAFWRIVQEHGLMAAPDSTDPRQASICYHHSQAIHADLDKLNALLSQEARTLMPLILMMVGDDTLTVERPEGETIH